MQQQTTSVRPSVVSPRRLALGVQVAIGAYTLLLVSYGFTGGTRSTYFAASTPLSGLLMIATAVLFLVWLRRCRINAEAFAPESHRHSTGLAVGGWFIPLAMWWIPRRVVLDIWRASGAVGGTRLVEAWWVAWLVKTVGLALYLRFAGPAQTFGTVVEAVNVLAAGLVILLVQRITAAQEARIADGVAALTRHRDMAA